MKKIYYECVIGRLLLLAEPEGLTQADFCGAQEKEPQIPVYIQDETTRAEELRWEEAAFSLEKEDDSEIREDRILAESCRELDEYFSGARQVFQVPLAEKGTLFQKQVWAALREIPYGETRSYGQIAAQIGRPKAARAVGMGCNRNPLLLFTPCHRVVGSNGALTGFACGLPVKAQLLAMEMINIREQHLRMGFENKEDK